MFVGRPAGMVGFRTHTFTRIGSIMDKKQSGSTKLKIMEDLELISLLNECNKMSVLEVSNYLLGKMDYLSRIKSDKSNKILKYIESFVWMINHAGNRRLSYVSDKDYELM